MKRGRAGAVHVVLLALLGTCCGQSDECTGYERCDDCIAGGDCVWCPDLPPFSGPRCTSPQNYNCSLELQDPVAPPPTPLRNDSVGGTVQITPQEIHLDLRTGRPQTFTLTVRPARNYPLDMYFLMDLSGSLAQDLETLRSLSTAITDELTSISTQFALGFGSFVDKIAYPYASILQNGMDYRENHFTNMRHHLPLSNDSSQFTEALNNATIQGNLDNPEATLEALLQAAVCVEDVRWRNESLRIVLVLTDAGFKTALDGKVAGLLIPNDGECHLKEVEVENEGTFYQYSRDPEQDFPSIYQVRQKLIENDIITVFAVGDPVNVTTTRDLYSMLSQELGSSRTFVQRINIDASDILGVITEAYESVTRDIVVEDISGLKIVSITPVSNCTLTSDEMGCADVSLEQDVQFNVTVIMEQCLEGSTMSSLSLPGFGNVLLHLEPICDCNCSTVKSPEHTACNEGGSLVCGLCECGAQLFGEQCSCHQALSPCPDDCSNRGTCDNCTRVCTSCDTMEVSVDLILGSYGSRCQCSNETSGGCPSGRSNLPCSGRDRGVCQCSDDNEQCNCMCECFLAPMSQRRYFGDDCSCNRDDCHNVQYPNRLCAHTQDGSKDGTCECKGCQCPSDSVSYNRTCINEEDLCTLFEECARCWPSNCTTDDGCTPNSLDDITSSGDPVSCLFERDNCEVDYEVVLSGPYNTIGNVYVGEERDCQSSDLGQLAWIIAVSIVGGILLLGVIILIVAKIILMAIDRKEYGRFLNDMHTGDFTPHNNPLYVTPESEYPNPTLHKRHSIEKHPDD